MLHAAKISNFKNVLNFELSKRGDFENLNYNPVFKSSAIFFVIIEKYINTKISFFNYWKFKNSNKNISCQITLRNIHGNKILRKFFRVELNTYTISMGDILNKESKIFKFIGSVEIELFSNYDLKYAFPAIDAIYETKKGISLVHSNQRVFDNLQDMLQNDSINQIQTGFDIYLDDQYQTFVAAINGPLKINNQKLKVDFFNSNGKKYSVRKAFKSIAPFEVIYLDFKNYKYLKHFLNEKRGYCKISLPTKNIFNRVVVGTFNKDKTKISTTHSYYDCSKTKDFVNLKNIKPEEYVCYLPFNLFEKIKLDIVLYPIFSKSNLNFSLGKISKDGKRTIINDSIFKISKNFKKLFIIEINKYLKDEKNLSNNIYFLEATSNNNEIPSRLAFGFNYKINSIGSNISDSMIINHGVELKSRGFYWGPAFISKKIKTVLAISNLDKNKKKIFKSIMKLRIYDEDHIVLKKKLIINCPGSINIDVNKIINNKIKKNDKIVWFTLESDSKNIVCKHVHISKFGHVTADHSF